MASKFKETMLRLLSATNYSLDNLSEDNISSFHNVPSLKPLLVWMSENLSEANCITPEELEEFQILQDQDMVKNGVELEEAIKTHFHKNQKATVPFQESLNDVEEELMLLKEQLHYKQVLHQALCSSNATAADDIRELRKKQLRAENEQKEVIKEICSVNKMFKEKVSELQENVNEIHDDIVGLVQNDGIPEGSPDEGIFSFTSEHIKPNKSLSSSLWSLATSSSWQTINSKDSNVKYLCQLSFDKYQRVHRQFLKRLTKLLENLSKVGKIQSNSEDLKELHNIKETLQNQMSTLLTKEAELEGIRAARDEVERMLSQPDSEAMTSELMRRMKELEQGSDESFNLTDGEELASVCSQWAEYRVMKAVEQKLRERIEYSKSLIEKMDQLLTPLLLKLNADKILLEVMRYEKERIEMSINFYKTFYQSMQTQYNEMEKRIETMQNNFQDYKEFCSLPLEKRSGLVEQLASMLFCDKEDVVEAIQHLTESSKKHHQTMFEHLIEEKNKLVSRRKAIEDSSHMAVLECNKNEETSSEAINSIQGRIVQIDSLIEEMECYLESNKEEKSAPGRMKKTVTEEVDFE